MFLRNFTLILFLFLFHKTLSADTDLIYKISQNNDAIVNIDLDEETLTTEYELDFYSQGQAVYNHLSGEINLLNPTPSPKEIIKYDLENLATSELAIANDDEPVLSLFGVNSTNNYYVLTDRFEELGEADEDAKRFAIINSDGDLTRIGTTLPDGSIFPQGTQLYNEINNTIYTVANDSTKVLVSMNLDTNEITSASTSATTLVGFTEDGKAIGLITGSENPKILLINLETGDETTLVEGVPEGGYDNFARGYVDIPNQRIIMMLGGRSVGDFSGAGIAAYNLSDGSLIKTFETEGQGRFVTTSLLKNVESGTETFSSNINGSLSTLLKLGSGRLIYTGTSRGGGWLRSGTMVVNGSFLSDMFVESGRLKGSGTVGSLSNFGTVAPGNSIGTLNVSGDVTLNSGSELVVEVNPEGDNDKIIATGNITAGGTLLISPELGTYNENVEYTILTGNSVSGTFTSVNTLSCNSAASASYNTTNITVNLSNCSTDGEDVIYAVQATGANTQDWGTIAPSTGDFTSITEISPTGLGWPLGDIGSEPDPINGYVFTRQTNSTTSETDILAIKKSDGSTRWLGIGNDHLVIGYDTKNNKLILNNPTESNSNRVISYDIESGTSSIIVDSFSQGNNSWQAGGIGAVDSYGRVAFQLRPDTSSTLYKINLDSGTVSTVTIDDYIVTIAWDSKNQKLYGLYDTNENGAYRVAEINTEDGSITNIGDEDTVGGLSNYVQIIAPNDQRYYVQEGENIVAVSLTTGDVLGTFSAPLRIMPPGTVVLGDPNEDQTVETDIEDPSSILVKLGDNKVNYTGTSISSGDTLVQDGEFNINGSIENSEATIYDDATLSGAGTIGAIINDGNLEPGNSIGTLNVSGDVTLNSGSVLVIEVDANGNNDKIIATGNVTAGGTLTISPESGTYNSTNDYTIITGSSIDGTFSSINVLSCSGTATAEYGSSDIVITLSDCFSGSSSQSVVPSNQSLMSSYINDLSLSGDLQTTINELNSLSGTDYNDAVQQLDTNNNSSTTAANLSVTNNINNIILLRSQLVQGSTSSEKTAANFLSDTKLQIENNLALGFTNSTNLMEGDGAWIKVHGSQGDRGDISDIGVNGFKNNYFATSIGFDDVRKDQVNGYSLTMANESTTFDRSEGSQSSSSYYLSSYQTSTLANSNQLTFIGTVGYKSNDTSRVINYGSIARTATGEFDNYLLDINAIVDVSQPNDSRHDISWSVGLMYDQQQGYTETGANSLNLSIDQSENYILKLGFYDNYLFDPIISNTTTIQPLLSAGLRFNQYLQTPQSSQKFVNQSSSFTTQTNEKSEILGDITLGAVITSGENSKFNIGIQTTQSNLSQEYSATAQYNYSF